MSNEYVYVADGEQVLALHVDKAANVRINEPVAQGGPVYLTDVVSEKTIARLECGMAAVVSLVPIDVL